MHVAHLHLIVGLGKEHVSLQAQIVQTRSNTIHLRAGLAAFANKPPQTARPTEDLFRRHAHLELRHCASARMRTYHMHLRHHAP
jgi:hypothetical protein